MYLFCGGLLDELIQHLLEIALGVGFQFRAECLGGRPILAKNVLADGKLALLRKGGQGRISRNGREAAALMLEGP